MRRIEAIAGGIGLFLNTYAAATFYMEQMVGGQFARYKIAMRSQTLKEKGEGDFVIKGDLSQLWSRCLDKEAAAAWRASLEKRLTTLEREFTILKKNQEDVKSKAGRNK